MKTKSNIPQDSFIIKFLDSRMFVFILLGIVLLYVFTDQHIINLPEWLFEIRFLIAIVIIIAIFLWRYDKYRDYYRQLFADKLNVVALVVVIVFCSTFLQLLMSAGINYYFVQVSKDNSTEIYDCEINDIQTSNKSGDRVGFVFRGQINSKIINTGNYKNNELIAHYVARIGVKKSLLGTYYLEYIQLVRKNN